MVQQSENAILTHGVTMVVSCFAAAMAGMPDDLFCVRSAAASSSSAVKSSAIPALLLGKHTTATDHGLQQFSNIHKSCNSTCPYICYETSIIGQCMPVTLQPIRDLNGLGCTTQ